MDVVTGTLAIIASENEHFNLKFAAYSLFYWELAYNKELHHREKCNHLPMTRLVGILLLMKWPKKEMDE